jgi:hypothetical protein
VDCRPGGVFGARATLGRQCSYDDQLVEARDKHVIGVERVRIVAAGSDR